MSDEKLNVRPTVPLVYVVCWILNHFDDLHRERGKPSNDPPHNLEDHYV